jgi:hypothetical protein
MVLWIAGPRVPNNMASRIYTIHTEELEARLTVYSHSEEECWADNKDCSYSSLLCQLGISDLGM